MAVSTGFRECVSDAMQYTRNLIHMGNTYASGPYAVQSGDPFASSPLMTQQERVLYAARSTSAISLSCNDTSGDPNLIAHAAVGSWLEDREVAESMTTAEKWLSLVAFDSGTSTTTAEFFQGTRQRAANGIWHEAMHQWGYRHASGSFTSSFMKTLPYIVGACMETVMASSAKCSASSSRAAW